jgi:hypothetical protein
LPELKSFLLEGHVDEYRDVEVVFIPGRNAVLTIFEDGQEQEKVMLSAIKTKDEMHKLMSDKGFERKTKEEIDAKMADKEKDRDQTLEDAKKKMRERYTNLKQNQKKNKERLSPPAPMNKDVERMLFDGKVNTKNLVANEAHGLAGQLLPLVSVSMVIGFVFLRRKKSKNDAYVQ